MRRLIFSNSSIPFLLLLITVSAYGSLVHRLGLFWDDWPLLWNAQTYGPSGLMDVFRSSRPFLLPIILFLTKLIPGTPLAWQVCGIVARFATSLAAWWCLKEIWPKHSAQTLSASLLFAVYPGFTQQWIPITYVSQLFIPLTAYLLSLGMTARAIRQPQKSRRLTALALIFAVLGLFPTEYFVGFEVLRLFVIRQAQMDITPRETSRVLKRWLPYSLMWAANLAWLVYYYASGVYQYYEPKLAETLGSNIIATLIHFASEIGNAVLLSGFLAWVNALPRLLGNPDLLLPFCSLAAGCFFVLWFYLSRLKSPEKDLLSRSWSLQAILLGLVWILAGRLPSWAAGLPLRLNFGWDRFLLPMMLGACLVAAGLLELVKNRQTRIILVCVLVALAAGQQYIHAHSFWKDWELQKEFFWQISWRMPAIQPNTVLLTQELPLTYETDLSLTAPINWLYASGLQSREIPYILLSTDLRLGGDKLPTLEPGLPLDIRYSAGAFRGSTADMIVFLMPASGCLKVLEPDSKYEKTLFGLSPEFKSTIQLSDISRIVPAPEAGLQPEILFGPEPPHGWCYYFEKAELADQAEDWRAVTGAGRKALNQGLSPRDPAEWLVFIEGYARTGSISSAVELSQNVWKEYPYLTEALCVLWDRLGEESAYTQSAEKMCLKMGCKP